MSANAVAACRAARVPLVVFTRPPWTREPGDRWIEVATMEDAAEALGAKPRTAFLTQGRLQLAAFSRAPQHRYIVRAIDRPAEIDALPNCKLILARGPFSLADELALMQRERVDALVTKNSGGRATYAKIEAARALGIEVVIVRRPPAPEPTVFRLDEAMAWIALIAGPVGARRHHPGPCAVAGDEARFARADHDERRHVGEPSVRFAKRRQGQRLVGASDRAGEGDRRRLRFQAPQQVERLRDAGRPRPRRRVIERDDEIALSTPREAGARRSPTA